MPVDRRGKSSILASYCGGIRLISLWRSKLIKGQSVFSVHRKRLGAVLIIFRAYRFQERTSVRGLPLYRAAGLRFILKMPYSESSTITIGLSQALGGGAAFKSIIYPSAFEGLA